jgi:hypothetical protein
MNLVSSVCHHAVGALYALATGLYAPVRWITAKPSASTIDSDWRVMLPVESADAGGELRLWWDALPETSSHDAMLQEEEASIKGALYGSSSDDDDSSDWKKED